MSNNGHTELSTHKTTSYFLHSLILSRPSYYSIVQDGLIRTPNLKGLQFIIENPEKAILEQFTEYYATVHAFHACTENFY